jgi:hypothetical protein
MESSCLRTTKELAQYTLASLSLAAAASPYSYLGVTKKTVTAAALGALYLLTGTKTGRTVSLGVYRVTVGSYYLAAGIGRIASNVLCAATCCCRRKAD